VRGGGVGCLAGSRPYTWRMVQRLGSGTDHFLTFCVIWCHWWLQGSHASALIPARDWKGVWARSANRGRASASCWRLRLRSGRGQANDGEAFKHEYERPVAQYPHRWMSGTIVRGTVVVPLEDPRIICGISCEETVQVWRAGLIRLGMRTSSR